MITARRSRILLLRTVDLGRIRPLESVRGGVVDSVADVEVEILRRNPLYFDLEYAKPLLSIVFTRGRRIRGAVPLIPRVDMVGVSYREEWYISGSGIACSLIRFSFDKPQTTEDLIQIANWIATPDSEVDLGGGLVFSIGARTDAVRNLLAPYVERRRTDYVRTYTATHIVDLDDQTMAQVKESPEGLAGAYPREVQALSVRVIKRWRERFPENGVFTERNTSLSPAGVLRINTRNALLYEYPYSDREIEDLYYPALAEVRIWDLLATTALQDVQRSLSELESYDIDEISTVHIRDLKRSALSSLNEFDGFFLATSKRTRNLYRAAYDEFDLRELRQILERKADRLDQIVGEIDSRRSRERERQVLEQQRESLEEANASSDRNRASAALLSLIGLATGLQVAGDLGDSFGATARTRLFVLAGVAIAYGVLYLWFFSGRQRFLFRRDAWVQVNIPTPMDDLEDSVRTKRWQYEVAEFAITPSRYSWVNRRMYGASLESRMRVELAYGLSDRASVHDGVLTLSWVLNSSRGRLSKARIRECMASDYRAVLTQIGLDSALIGAMVSEIGSRNGD